MTACGIGLVVKDYVSTSCASCELGTSLISRLWDVDQELETAERRGGRDQGVYGRNQRTRITSAFPDWVELCDTPQLPIGVVNFCLRYLSFITCNVPLHNQLSPISLLSSKHHFISMAMHPAIPNPRRLPLRSTDLEAGIRRSRT